MLSSGVKTIAGRWEVKFRPAVLNIRAYKTTLKKRTTFRN